MTSSVAGSLRAQNEGISSSPRWMPGSCSMCNKVWAWVMHLAPQRGCPVLTQCLVTGASQIILKTNRMVFQLAINRRDI
jgi:hypothetical protein